MKLHSRSKSGTGTGVLTPKSKQASGKHARERIRSGVMMLNKYNTSLDVNTAISLFSPGVKGAYVNKSGCCIKGNWEDAGARTRSDVMNHMIDSVHHVAKAFCPNDSQKLVKAVLNHGATDAHRAVENQTLKNFSQSPVIKNMLHEYKWVRMKVILLNPNMHARTVMHILVH